MVGEAAAGDTAELGHVRTPFNVTDVLLCAIYVVAADIFFDLQSEPCQCLRSVAGFFVVLVSFGSGISASAKRALPWLISASVLNGANCSMLPMGELNVKVQNSRLGPAMMLLAGRSLAA
jgi:hypothetical protein